MEITALNKKLYSRDGKRWALFRRLIRGRDAVALFVEPGVVSLVGVIPKEAWIRKISILTLSDREDLPELHNAL